MMMNSNGPICDAERLMAPFLALVVASPIRLALERKDDYLALFGGALPHVDFTNTMANFEAHVSEPSVEIRFSALLSLWATAKAALHISNAMAAAMRDAIERNEDSAVLQFKPGTTTYEGRVMIDLAKVLIEDANAKWRSDVASPDHSADLMGTEAKINNLFLGACGWCILHEIAHIVLGHQATTSRDRLLQQEFEADEWATNWILDRCPTVEERRFRILCCATALAWVGLVDAVRRGSSDHPHASERLVECAGRFGDGDLSGAIEIAMHLLKALFVPVVKLPVANDAEDALFDVLFSYLREDR
jgi:Peptidase U49